MTDSFSLDIFSFSGKTGPMPAGGGGGVGPFGGGGGGADFVAGDALEAPVVLRDAAAFLSSPSLPDPPPEAADAETADGSSVSAVRSTASLPNLFSKRYKAEQNRTVQKCDK